MATPANITHLMWIFTLGCPDPSPEPAPSALKEKRCLGYSILHRSGQTLAVLSQRPCFIAMYAISRWTTCGPGKQCATECTLPFLRYTWRSVLNQQVGLRLHYNNQHLDVRMFLLISGGSTVWAVPIPDSTDAERNACLSSDEYLKKTSDVQSVGQYQIATTGSRR